MIMNRFKLKHTDENMMRKKVPQDINNSMFDFWTK